MAKQSFWLSGRTIAVCLLVGVVGYLLVRDHTDHIFQYLPFAILLLCPLMHLFMHGGHGGHEGHDNNNAESPEEAYRRGLEEGRSSRHSRRPE